MAASRQYTVIEADYLDQEEGIVVGVLVAAEPGSMAEHLMVTSVNGEQLPVPVAVHTSQLRALEGAGS